MQIYQIQFGRLGWFLHESTTATNFCAVVISNRIVWKVWMDNEG